MWGRLFKSLPSNYQNRYCPPVEEDQDIESDQSFGSIEDIELTYHSILEDVESLDISVFDKVPAVPLEEVQGARRRQRSQSPPSPPRTRMRTAENAPPSSRTGSSTNN